MGIPVFILGKSGSGKSASLRNFDPKEVAIFNVASKPLPFKGGAKFTLANGAGYAAMSKVFNDKKRAEKFKTYVIDDSQYLMAFDSFAKAEMKGYDKFTTMAVNFYNLLQDIILKLPRDTIVYLLHHVDTDENGDTKAKTIGKMLDQQLCIEGLVSIVLMAVITDRGEYKFLTRNNGHNTVKTPMDMFDSEYIDNDLKAVDTAIREYYGFIKEDNEDAKN